jgi:hypothetical protein
LEIAGDNDAAFWQSQSHPDFPAGITWGAANGLFTMSNEAQARLASSLLPAVPGRAYRLDVAIQGELLPALSYGRGQIAVHFYNANNQKLSQEHLVWHSDDWSTFTPAFTPPTNAATMKVVLETTRVNGWLSFTDLHLTHDSPPVNLTAGQSFDLSLLISGQTDSGGQAIVRYFDSEDNFLLSQATLWQSDVYQNPQGVTYNGSFTAPANAASFRLGLTTPLLDGWLAYEDMVLTSHTSSIPISAGNNYQLSLQLAGSLPAAQSARIMAHYDTGETVELWHNPADYQSDGMVHELFFTAPAKPGRSNTRIHHYPQNVCAERPCHRHPHQRQPGRGQRPLLHPQRPPRLHQRHELWAGPRQQQRQQSRLTATPATSPSATGAWSQAMS